MSVLSIAALLATVLVTSTISGVFGMAGGVILMGVLAALLPVSAAMITHGVIQLAANGSRAFAHRGHIAWPILGSYLLGAAAAWGGLAVVAFHPSAAFVHLGLAAVSFLVWLPAKRLALNAQFPAHAGLCGFSVTGLNISAGVAGPLLDVFFVNTALTRHQIVATKAVTQVASHLAKIGFYASAALAASNAQSLPPLWLFIIAIPLSFLGTALGAQILDRMSDKRFLDWTKALITVMGFVFLWRGLVLLGQSA
jgi:uncharacterized membrane protein YfcA